MRRGMTHMVAPFVSALVLAGCETSDLVAPDDLRELAAAEARWRARSFGDYSYEIRVLCFCAPEVTQWTRVTVRDGAVTAAEAVDPNSTYPITTIQYWEPIDSLFVDLRRSMTDRASKTHLDAIIAEYDPELGYPTNIEYRTNTNVIDGGSQFQLRNVKPLD